jgi:ABC-type transport system involved in multi-copper enzyme maturation permease subunit
VKALARAELLRLRKRRSLQVIVLAIPLLVGVITVLSYNSLYEFPTFDEASYRQELIDSGYVLGVPPDQAEALLAEAIESQRQMYAQQEEQVRLSRAAFTFPRSLTMALGTGVFMLLGLVLLTATTIGDEFGWGTIRTSLLASTNRRRFLVVRLGAVVVASVVILGLLLLVGVIAPLILNIPANKLPTNVPAFDGGGLLVMLAGEAVAGMAVIAFAAAVTLLVRNGAFVLLAALVWIAVEAAILTLLTRFPEFAGTYSDNGVHTPGPLGWVLDAFPLHGITTLMRVSGQAASGLPTYPGEFISRDLGMAGVPIVSFAILAVVFEAVAFRRFQRMDIVE